MSPRKETDWYRRCERVALGDESEPESIREAAEVVERKYNHVHRNLSEPEAIGVIEFEGGGSGRMRKPILAYDLEIAVTFAGSE